MRKSFFYFGAAALLLVGCKGAQPQASKEPVILTLGDRPVYTSEFQYVYNKNNGSAENAYTQASVQEYLDLYTNFKLKVMDAESRGLDTTLAFRRELDGYKQQLAQPYLTEKSVTEKLIREAYDRMKQEINASHILINVPPDAEPKDTLAAYNKILDLRKRILAGEDFNKLAQTYSEDPSAKENHGTLGYFTALQMVYPFEDAAYKTPVGQLSNPVRTRFGYHLIKVNNVRPAQGEVKVSHIMVRATPGMPKADSVAAKRKIDEIYTRVVRKENWDRLVAQFSEDVSSNQNGGELPWFGTGRMLPSFEEVAFKLAKPGDISKPVQTPYGWHIIKLVERRSLPSYDDMETSLRNRVAKDSRSELNKAAFIKRIKTENNFLEIPAAKQYALGKADSSLVKGSWKNRFPEKETNTPLFSIQGKNFRVKDFFDYAEQNQKPKPKTSPAHAMQLLYDGFAEQSLLNYEKENLENKHLDYKMLVQEYREGILLFQLMDEKVWSKAIEDTVGLKTFFDQNRENYKWDTRAEATILSAANKQILEKAQPLLNAGRYEARKNKPAPVLFAANATTLSARATAQLDELANRLTADPNLSVILTGQADAREATRKNTLVQQRASQVSSYLLNKGVPAAQVSINNTPAGNRQRAVTLDLYSKDVKVLEQVFNENNPLALQVTNRRFGKGESKILDKVNWQEGTYTLEQDGRFYLVQVHKILPPGYKNLNETRGIATSDYQNYLEKQWVTELRQRYPVKVNQAEVDKLVKK
ncbi:peptidylprolyl isomerase [Adhaeribacter rhizoryzae]|uniref:OmpA family protein n=1 Tax=Adhaeribacter rhizoryzae TaxID=2607907 RepID=A0A5M6DTI4_9BACT|nr:peptidylprolyl isomerase [Adhaeribacter rhizoryzae]KAA5549450.1 OmpA family protein [Adhaeribacter rhizoryzae]